jgi:hypothetical protein
MGLRDKELLGHGEATATGYHLLIRTRKGAQCRDDLVHAKGDLAASSDAWV